MYLAKTCHLCALAKSRTHIVWGEGPEDSPIMFVAEAPGTVEDREGTPLHRLAKTGMEFNMLLRRRSISRERSYVTNLVKCHPPRDEDPSPECILACSTYLEREILRVNPRMIVAVGRHATRYLLNHDTDMEMVHGIPFMTNLPYLPTQIPVLPVYHPASGLHDPNRMLQVQQDFDCIKPVLTGELAPRTAYYSDPFVTQEQYRDDGTWEIQTQKGESPIVAIDTEWVQGGPWCLTVSSKPGTAYLLYAYMKSEIADLDEVLKSTNSLVLLHNAPYDLPVLHKLGLYPARFLDTMNMAYLLQSEPQGLKALAFRIAGMRMENYLDMVAPATHRNAMLYLARILHHDWPTPPPLLTWDHGTPKIKQPWPIHKKVAGILRDQHAKSANPWKRWHDITLQEGRKMVEDTLGPMPLGDLSQIPRDKAVRYACRDSDATLRIYPYLEHRLRTLGLLGALDDDMGALPMACDMMETGITADRAHFAVLEKRFADKADNLQADIQQIAGWSMNPGSHDDVRKLLFTDLDLGKGRKIKRTKKGGELSTTDKVISQLLTLHPVVRKIKDYRGYRKLETTYARQMPNWIHPATGRIHTNIRLTRTATGRLCVDPETLIEAPRNMSVYPEGIPLHMLKPGDYVYSFDWRRELCVKRVVWAGPTKRCATVIVKYRADMDSPIQTLTLSPEHLVRLFHGKWQHAGKLRPGERLLCMVTRHQHGQGYYNFFPHSRSRGSGQRGGGKGREHRFVFSQVYLNGQRLSAKHIIHHEDCDPQNNTPSNLKFMDNITEHQRAHRYSIEELRKTVETGIGKKGRKLTPGSLKRYASRLQKLELGDAIVGRNHVVVSVEPGPVKQLWDLEVEDTHCFIGNDVALHNSTFDPNLMAVPVRSDESREIRNGFVAEPGCTFLSADFSQIELRILAHESQDPLMLEVFRTGGDIHSRTASEVFGVPIPNLDKYLHRLPAKRVNFGIPYGIQAPGLQDTLAADGVDITLWTQDRCAEFIEEWFRLYSGVRRWRNGVIAFARRNGYVQDMFGRIRFLAGMHAADKWIILETERQAGNMPIQAGAAGIIKRAMGALVPVYRDFTREGWYIRPLLQIHDDLLWEVEDGFLDTAAIVIRSIMENTTPLSVPTPVDPEIGKRWGEKTEWEYGK